MTKPLTVEEFDIFEVLLGSLLEEVSDQEAQSILLIHARLEEMLGNQVSRKAALDRLRNKYQAT